MDYDKLNNGLWLSMRQTMIGGFCSFFVFYLLWHWGKELGWMSFKSKHFVSVWWYGVVLFGTGWRFENVEI